MDGNSHFDTQSIEGIDEAIAYDDVGDQTSPADGGSGKKKKRVRHWTADDRAAHRVFERSRREAFKERLVALANLIPSLQGADPSRLSKHIVVDRSISFHEEQQKKLQAALDQVDKLVVERDKILVELNEWRTRAGLDMTQAQALAAMPELDVDATALASTSEQQAAAVPPYCTDDMTGSQEPPIVLEGLHSEGEQVTFGSLLDPLDHADMPVPGHDALTIDADPKWDDVTFALSGTDAFQPDMSTLALNHVTQNQSIPPHQYPTALQNTSLGSYSKDGASMPTRTSYHMPEAMDRRPNYLPSPRVPNVL